MQVLGVPGNPVSSYVCAFLFVVPLLRRLAGRKDIARMREAARLGCDLPANDEREDYLRATLTARARRAGRYPVTIAGQLFDGSARRGRLSADSGTTRAVG